MCSVFGLALIDFFFWISAIYANEITPYPTSDKIFDIQKKAVELESDLSDFFELNR